MFLKLEEDMKTWPRCGLSLLGRINAIKMTLLPHFLYLFRSLPHTPDPGSPTWKSNWIYAFRRSFKGIMNISLIEASIKVFTRWYYVPARLARIYPDASPLCYRGCGLEGTMPHIWWTCPRIRSYWNKFFHMLRKVAGVAVPQDPTYALLNNMVKNLPKHTQQPVLFMCLGAKLAIMKAWKKPIVLILATKRKISWIMSQEQIVAKLLDTVQ